MKLYTSPPWLVPAQMAIGVQEHVGPGSNPAVMQWARDIGAPAYTDDDIAWCAVYVNRVLLGVGLPMSGTGYALVRAGSFATWGVPLAQPALGAVLVFKRPEGFHVGFYVGERADAFYVLGGNQRNSVSIVPIEKARCIAMRWPAGLPLPTGGPLLLASDGRPLSTNEA